MLLEWRATDNTDYPYSCKDLSVYEWGVWATEVFTKAYARNRTLRNPANRNDISTEDAIALAYLADVQAERDYEEAWQDYFE